LELNFVAFYGYCGPTSILFVLKKAREELRLRVIGKGVKGNRGNGGKQGKPRLNKEEVKEMLKRKKIYSLLLHLPNVNQLGDTLKTSEKLGTQPEDMVRFLKRTGFQVRVREEASWQELKKALNDGKMVLVDWWTDIGDPGEDLGHYSVVTRISSKTLTIYDPDINKKRVLGKNTFLERWHDVRADGRKMLSWMAEIKI
jgi:predicted double-glycine peptidase